MPLFDSQQLGDYVMTNEIKSGRTELHFSVYINFYFRTAVHSAVLYQITNCILNFIADIESRSVYLASTLFEQAICKSVRFSTITQIKRFFRLGIT